MKSSPTYAPMDNQQFQYKIFVFIERNKKAKKILFIFNDFEGNDYSFICSYSPVNFFGLIF